MATRHEDNYTITRVTRYIHKPFSEVLARLESSIKQSDHGRANILEAVDSKQQFEDATNQQLGPHGFMQFFQLNHGSWMGLYGVQQGKQAIRVIFGNPQIAITMLKHDVNAGLFVPVEALLVESEDGKSTVVVQVKPS